MSNSVATARHGVAGMAGAGDASAADVAREPSPPRRATAVLGFTLLELLIVVAIIAVLAAYVGPKDFAQVGRSEQTLARAQAEAFVRALGAYRLDAGRYPNAQEGLEALVRAPAGLQRWHGPYLEKGVPPDPWGRPYIYRAPGAQSEFEVISYGKDGTPGGSGDAADIVAR